MSDEQLRALERYLQSAPEDFLGWAQYLQAGARAGAYDPDSWAQTVSWLTKVPPVVDLRNGEEPYTPEALIAAKARWSDATDMTEKILHGVRNVLGQLSASELRSKIEPVLVDFYSRPRPVTISSDYGLFPVLEIGDTYRILYDERSFYHRSNNPRRPRWEESARSALNTTPQYIIETDVYSPGSYHQPPDSDQIILGVTNNIRDLIRELLYAIETNENQEIYYDPRDEEFDFETNVPDTMALIYRTQTMQLIKETLDSLFSRYRINIYASQLFDEDNRFGIRFQTDDLNFTVYDTKEFVWPYVTNNGMPVLPGSFIIESYLAGHTQRYFQQAATGVIEHLWQLWLKIRLDRYLTK